MVTHNKYKVSGREASIGVLLTRYLTMSHFYKTTRFHFINQICTFSWLMFLTISCPLTEDIFWFTSLKVKTNWKLQIFVITNRFWVIKKVGISSVKRAKSKADTTWRGSTHRPDLAEADTVTSIMQTIV